MASTQSQAGVIVETGILAGVWSAVLSSRAELIMFAAAMVAYFVLFNQRVPRNSKHVNKMKMFEAHSDSKPSPRQTAPRSTKTSPKKETTGLDVGKHITMIRSCAKEKDLKGAKAIFEQMEQGGVELNCIIYNAMLDACVECRDLKSAEEWMDCMKAAKMTDVVSFNTLIKAHLQSGSFEKARQLMKLMKEQGVQPNQVTYNELMNAIAGMSKSGDARRQQMWDVVDEMRRAEMQPNQVTLSILLKNLNSYAPQAEILRTMDLIKSMEEPMDEVLLSSVAEACVRVGKVDLLVSQLRRWHDSAAVVINGSHTYGSLIKAYGYAKDLPRVWKCWKEMRSRHIKPTSITLGCMVEAIVNNGDTEGAYDLTRQVQDDDQCRDVVNSIIYCSILKGFTREKKVDRCWVVYEEMKSMNAELSIVTYNTLIDACARCGRMDRLTSILDDMKSNGTKPNVITYSTMLKGHCQNGDVRSGFKILEQIRKDPELKPDEIMYNSLLDGCAQNNLVTEGLQLLEDMQSEGVYPSNFTLSILVKMMNRARRVDQAFAVVQDITTKYNFEPNVHVYTNLIQACIFNQQFPRGLRLLEQMVAERVVPDSRTYAILVRACMNKGMFNEAAGLLKGALGLPDAPKYLQTRSAACSTIDFAMVNETLSTLNDRGHGHDLAVPLLTSIRQHSSWVRIDPATQRKVMSPCISK